MTPTLEPPPPQSIRAAGNPLDFIDARLPKEFALGHVYGARADAGKKSRLPSARQREAKDWSRLHPWWPAAALVLASIALGVLWPIAFVILFDLVTVVLIAIFYNTPELDRSMAPQPQLPQDNACAKPRAIALFSADRDLQNAAMTAVLGSRRGLRRISDLEDAVQILKGDLSDLDMVLIDLDLDPCGVALGNALRVCGGVPVAVITRAERVDPRVVAMQEKAAACLMKPTTPKRLSEVIERFTTSQPVLEKSLGPINCLGPGLWSDAKLQFAPMNMASSLT